MNTMNFLPVTIVVVTFNSEKTIIETLNSLLQQDYPALEIVVSDDASKDNTVNLVEQWKLQHEASFQRIVVLKSATNQGICRNVAKAYSEARGEWLKPIAGDDFLLPDAISGYMAMARDSSHSVIVSKVIPFIDSSEIDVVKSKVIPSEKNSDLISGPSDKLLQSLYVRNEIPAPGIFLRKRDYQEIGGIDISFSHLDDWPLWINMLEAGKSFGWLPQPLVAYRISIGSVSAGRNSTHVSVDFLQDHLTFYKKYQVGKLGFLNRWDRMLEIWRFRLAKGPLRPYPRVYTATGIVRLFSPIYMALRLGIIRPAQEKLDENYIRG